MGELRLRLRVPSSPSDSRNVGESLILVLLGYTGHDERVGLGGSVGKCVCRCWVILVDSERADGKTHASARVRWRGQVT